MVSKRRNSPYRSDESNAWVKTKCWDVDRLDLIGVKREVGKRSEGLFAKEGKYVGKVVIAATRAIKERLWQRIESAIVPSSPPACPRRSPTAMSSELSPASPGRVRHLRGEPKLRHASVQDLREDGG